MSASGVVFDSVAKMVWGENKIVLMECYRTKNAVRKEKLPLILTVEEDEDGYLFGYLSLEVRRKIKFHWISPLSQDDFFAYAEGLALTWLETKEFPERDK